MKIFRIIRKRFAFLGIKYSLDQPTQKLPFNKRVFFGLTSIGCLIILQFVYIFHVGNGFTDYVDSICAIAVTISLFVGFVTISCKRASLAEHYDKFEKIIEARSKYPKSEVFFFETNQRVERLSEIVFTIFVKIIPQFVVLSKCIVSFATYFNTDSGPDSFQLPIPMWFPFDANNPTGYLIAIIYEYIMQSYGFFMIACTLTFAIGTYLLTNSVIEEIQCILHLINDKTEANELKALLLEFIYIYAEIKQLIHDFSDTFQPIIMLLFTWNLFGIAAAMFIIQMEILHHENDLPLLLLISNGIIGTVMIFIACEIGQRISDAFAAINFTIGHFDWYLFPFEIQRMLPIIITSAQQPIELECFGSISCTRDVFKNIIHRAYSYFTVLHQLGD